LRSQSCLIFQCHCYKCIANSWGWYRRGQHPVARATHGLLELSC
jgi:hypothetical protein